MLSRLDIIFGIALPILIGVVAVLVSRRVGAAMAPGVALAVAVFGVQGWPRWPITDSLMWMGFIGVAVAIVALRNAIVELPIIVRVLGAAVISFFVVYLVAGKLPEKFEENHWEWLAGFSAAMLVIWLSSELAAQRASARNSSLLFILLAGTSAVVMALTGSQSMGNREGTIALAMMGSLIFGGRVSAIGFVPLWGMIMIAHYVYNDGPVVPMVLVAVSPLLWWSGELVRNEKWSRVVRVGVALIPQIIALVMVAVEFSHHLDEL